jgi:hypothetical protein
VAALIQLHPRLWSRSRDWLWLRFSVHVHGAIDVIGFGAGGEETHSCRDRAASSNCSKGGGRAELGLNCQGRQSSDEGISEACRSNLATQGDAADARKAASLTGIW